MTAKSWGNNGLDLSTWKAPLTKSLFYRALFQTSLKAKATAVTENLIYFIQDQGKFNDCFYVCYILEVIG